MNRIKLFFWPLLTLVSVCQLLWLKCLAKRQPNDSNDDNDNNKNFLQCAYGDDAAARDASIERS